MFDYVSVVGTVTLLVATLMVVAMLYLVWESLDGDAHKPSPGETEQPELGDEGEETNESQGELAADSNSA